VGDSSNLILMGVLSVETYLIALFLVIREVDFYKQGNTTLGQSQS